MVNQVPECGLISPKQNNVYTTVHWWLQPLSAGGTSWALRFPIACKGSIWPLGTTIPF